jgi:hypothetical protein
LSDSSIVSPDLALSRTWKSVATKVETTQPAE